MNAPKLIKLAEALLLGVFTILALSLAHSPRAKAYTIVENGQYPRSGTSNFTIPNGSSFWNGLGPLGVNTSVGASSVVESGPGAPGYVYNPTGQNAPYLWDTDSTHTYDKPDTGYYANPPCGSSGKGVVVGDNWCWDVTRSNGGQLFESDYEVIVPSQLTNVGMQVTVKNACIGVRDSTNGIGGWEDHRYNTPNQNNNSEGLSVDSVYGSKSSSTCSGGDLVLTLSGNDFQAATDLGSNRSRAFIKVTDNYNHQNVKTFSVFAPGAFVGPMPGSGKFVNVRNPSADYSFNTSQANNGQCLTPHPKNNPPPGTQLNVAYPANCPAQVMPGGGYSTLNNPYSEDTFYFYFSPDATCNLSPTLYWRDGQGQPGVTQDVPPLNHKVTWKLIDLSKNNSIVDQVTLTSGYATNAVSSRQETNLITGDQYVWEWDNVGRAHGVSVQLPYSEYTLSSTYQSAACGQTGDIVTATCNNITIDGYNKSNQNQWEDWQVWYQNPPGQNPQYVTYAFGSRNRNDTGPSTSGFGKINVNQSSFSDPTVIWDMHALLPGGVNLFLRIKVNNQWFWVKSSSSPDSTSATNISPAYTPSGSYAFYFMKSCPPPNAPIGAVQTADCVFGGLTGFAQDPDSSATALAVQVYYQRSNPDFSFTNDPNPVTQYTTNSFLGYYVANLSANPVPGQSNPYPGHVFSISLSPTTFIDGYAYKFYVYPLGVDTSGQQDGINNNLSPGVANGNNPFVNNALGGLPYTFNPFPNPVYGIVMNPCGNFTTNASTNLSLSTTTQNPTNYTTSNDIYISYNPGVNTQFNPTINMTCTNYADFSRVGGPTGLAIPTSYCPNGSYNTNTAASPFGGASGPTIPPPQAGDTYCSNLTPQYGSGVVEENISNGGGLVWSSVPGTTVRSGCKSVVNEPYFKVFGNGISATGGASSGVCTGGELASWNNDSGLNPGVGAGSQLSNIATVAITGVASGQNSATFTGPPPGVGLTFANNTNTSGNAPGQDSPNMGGNFGSSSSNYCTPSQTSPPPGAQPIGNGTIGAAGGITSGDYKATGTATITGGNLNGKATVFVPGDVYIQKGSSNGITYTNSSSGWTWSSTSNNIPSFKLVAYGGNIYIDSNITELDGTYIAEKNGTTGGKIYTCANGAGVANLVAAPSMYGGCSNQLVVHGSFIADQINLMRTYGSLRNSNSTENRTGGGGNCSNRGASPAGYSSLCAAEIFDYSPEQDLTNTNSGSTSSGGIHYDYFTNLPPVL